MELAPAVDHTRRPRNSHKVIASTPAMEHQVALLTQHAVVITAVGTKAHAASPLSIGRALEKELKVPPHLLRVTAHDPEDFFVFFNLPGHKDLAVRHGSLIVDGVPFLLEPWREDAHAVHQKWMLHVRVVIEKLPMQLWTLEGAVEVLGDKVIVDRLDSRTFERADTKLFACWVWVWNLSFIPTKRTIWKHARGAGRVEEMLGYSPPSRAVAPPPELLQYDLLLHMDRVEDWTPLSPRSSHSPQSGLPSEIGRAHV